jgi:hypothetical protein
VTFKQTADSNGAERFNVYGMLRSLSGDGDQWYIDAKPPFPDQYNDSRTSAVNIFLDLMSLQSFSSDEHKIYVESLVSSELISLHYMSQQEVNIVYKMLTFRGASDTGGCGSACIDSNNVSVSELVSMWPHNDRDAGHYSRWKWISPVEQQVLHWYLTEYAKVKNHAGCGSVAG